MSVAFILNSGYDTIKNSFHDFWDTEATCISNASLNPNLIAETSLHIGGTGTTGATFTISGDSLVLDAPLLQVTSLEVESFQISTTLSTPAMTISGASGSSGANFSFSNLTTLNIDVDTLTCQALGFKALGPFTGTGSGVSVDHGSLGQLLASGGTASSPFWASLSSEYILYVDSGSTGSGNGGLLSPFSTIQQGVSAGEELYAGGSAHSQAVIFIAPGLYQEDITVTTPNISLTGYVPASRQTHLTAIEGSVTISLSVAGNTAEHNQVALYNLHINGSISDEKNAGFSGNADHTLIVSECRVQGAGTLLQQTHPAGSSVDLKVSNCMFSHAESSQVPGSMIVLNSGAAYFSQLVCAAQNTDFVVSLGGSAGIACDLCTFANETTDAISPGVVSLVPTSVPARPYSFTRCVFAYSERANGRSNCSGILFQGPGTADYTLQCLYSTFNLAGTGGETGGNFSINCANPLQTSPMCYFYSNSSGYYYNETDDEWIQSCSQIRGVSQTLTPVVPAANLGEIGITGQALGSITATEHACTGSISGYTAANTYRGSVVPTISTSSPGVLAVSGTGEIAVSNLSSDAEYTMYMVASSPGYSDTLFGGTGGNGTFRTVIPGYAFDFSYEKMYFYISNPEDSLNFQLRYVNYNGTVPGLTYTYSIGATGGSTNIENAVLENYQGPYFAIFIQNYDAITTCLFKSTPSLQTYGTGTSSFVLMPQNQIFRTYEQITNGFTVDVSNQSNFPYNPALSYYAGGYLRGVYPALPTAPTPQTDFFNVTFNATELKVTVTSSSIAHGGAEFLGHINATDTATKVTTQYRFRGTFPVII